MKKLNFIIISACTLIQFTLNADMSFKNDSNFTFDINIQYRKNHHNSDQNTKITLQPHTGNTVVLFDNSASLKNITITNEKGESHSLSDLLYSNQTPTIGGYYELWATPNNKMKFTATQYTDSSYKKRVR